MWEVLVLKAREYAPLIRRHAEVKPCHGSDGRLPQRLVIGDEWAGDIARLEPAVLLGVQLVNPTESSELALDAIEVAVVIGVGCRSPYDL